MSIINIEGKVPLSGNIQLSGARNSVLKLIPASLFCNEDVTFDNVPRVASVVAELEIVKHLGAKVEWVGSNKFIINASTLADSTIPFDLGSRFKTTCLLAAPLVYRFGKADIPKSRDISGLRKINRLLDTWQTLGIEVVEDAEYFHLKAESQILASNISFKVSTHMGTDNAILTALFASGETIINNAGEENEIEDLIAFCNQIGGSVERIEPRRIKVIGKNVFNGTNFKIQNDKDEAVAFAVAAIITGGSVNIKGIDKQTMIAFTNVLTKMNAKFEFVSDELRIWTSPEQLQAVDVTSSPAPGFMTAWLPLITLALTKAKGVSLVHDTIYTDKFYFVKDLNMMGAGIEVSKPSQVGLVPVISDDNYDYGKIGEPYSVAKVTGPARLKGTKINLSDMFAGVTIILAALGAEGKSEIGNYEIVEYAYENFYQKLINLGAKITTV